VPRDAIERIVSTVRRAPSAGFSQGQRLLVVTEQATRDAIGNILGDRQWVSEAPVLVVVGVREDNYHERYTKPDKLVDGREIEWPVPYWHFDAGAAAMLILLAAIDEGYAARPLRRVRRGYGAVQAVAEHPRRRRRHLLHHHRQPGRRLELGRAHEPPHAGAQTGGRPRPLGALGYGVLSFDTSCCWW
jgi:nitroreductase family protein